MIGVVTPDVEAPPPKRFAKAPVADSCERRLRSTPPTKGGCVWGVGTGESTEGTVEGSGKAGGAGD
jgi:hypothetical protein